MKEIPRLFDSQKDWIYNLDVWVLLNWEVRKESKNLYTVWRRNLVSDNETTLGRIKHRANCSTLSEAFHYVECHIKDRDQP